MTNTELKEITRNLEVDVKHDFPDDFPYKWAVIRQQSDGFIWTVEMNFKVSGHTGYRFPKDAQRRGYVKHYKTLNACRNSLYKYLE
jgi:hypothetical protein